MGEGFDHPVVMLRRDRWKLVYSRRDGASLYDLDADPLETRNLANDIAYEEQVRGLIAEIERRWDLDRIQADVLESPESPPPDPAGPHQKGKISPGTTSRASTPATSTTAITAPDMPDPERTLRFPARRD